MVKMIQVRNVSDRLHRELVRRARMQGQTLTDYVEQILERELARPARGMSHGNESGARCGSCGFNSHVSIVQPAKRQVPAHFEQNFARR